MLCHVSRQRFCADKQRQRGSRFLEVISAELSHAITTSYLLSLFRTGVRDQDVFIGALFMNLL